MKTLNKIFGRLTIFIAAMLILPAFLYASTGKDQIASDLSKAGFRPQKIERKTIPGTNNSYYTAKVTRNGKEYKIKVFDGKYFISGAHGKLKPLNISSPGRIQRSLIKPSKVKNQKRKKSYRHLRKPIKKKSDSELSYKEGKYRKGGSEHLSANGNRLGDGENKVKGNTAPAVKLASSPQVDNAAKSFDNGCYPANFSRIADFGLGMQDTAKVLNYDSLSHEGMNREMNMGLKDKDGSRDFRKSKRAGSAEEVLGKADRNSKNNPVAKSQAELQRQINSKEMQKYSMKTIWEVLNNKKPSGKLTPDQLVARRNIERLVKSLRKQGKNNKQIYTLLNRQTKRQFAGRVALKGKDPNRPWTMRSDGKLIVHSHANNRDQVLSYTAQALTLQNDPIFVSKRNEWRRSNKKLDDLKRNATFESDYSQMKSLETRIHTLSKELSDRQKEIFS